jgi:hypothetical protein
MQRLVFVLSIACLVWIGSHASAQESAKVQVTIRIPAATPSFKDQRLVVMLYHNFPTQDDRGDKAVDRHIDAKFSHTKGADTLLTITLGEKAKLKREVQYSVNVSVFTRDSKQTHRGELEGRTGPFSVLTNGAPSKLTLQVRPVP